MHDSPCGSTNTSSGGRWAARSARGILAGLTNSCCGMLLGRQKQLLDFNVWRIGWECEDGDNRLKRSLVNFFSRPEGIPYRPRVRRDYPPNLSILISGGKETNRDSLSKGD